MASFTPGPWKVLRRYSNGCEIVPMITCDPDPKKRECGWIADLIGAPYLGYESTLPNAYLVAAAPDLLAALMEARQFIANGIEFGYIRTPGEGTREAKCLPMIEAAIAKASGAK